MALQIKGTTVELTTTATAVTLPGVGANDAVVIQSASVANRDSVTRLVTFHIGRNGASAGATNVVEQDRPIPINVGTDVILAGKLLGPGDILYAKADANSVCNLDLGYSLIPQTS